MIISSKLNKILIVMLSCLLLFSLVIPVFADDGYVGIAVFAKEMADTVYGSSNSFTLQGAIEVLLFVPGNAGSDTEMMAMNSIWDYAEKAYNSLMSIGASIALLFFLLEVMDKTTREMMTLEQFIIFFIKLISFRILSFSKIVIKFSVLEMSLGIEEKEAFIVFPFLLYISLL